MIILLYTLLIQDQGCP